MQKKWIINKKAPKSFLNKFPEYSNITLQLLWDRNLKTQKSIDEFFNPDYSQDLHNPLLLKGLKKTIKRIEMAGRKREKVAVFADYDADGICGATILFEILKIYKIRPEIYIPDRQKEGYGMNIKAVKSLIKKNISLIITVDCGITDFDEVELANKNKIDVIITDHHKIPKTIPRAYSIINPLQKDCKYPFKFLSGCGVVFKLAQAIRAENKLPISWEKWMLDLVAISTATDSMPLLGENRALMKYGLIVLSQTKRKGLKALMKKARIEPVYNSQAKETNLSPYSLGFLIGPRINAASRVDHGSLAFNILNSNNEERIEKLAELLEKKNNERQQMTKKIYIEAKKRVLKNIKNIKIIFEGDKNWPAGILGLIAQKLREDFYMPVFIFQKNNDFCTGSVRSAEGIDVVKIMKKHEKVLIEQGGHSLAAGFRILAKNIEIFKNLMEKEVKKILKGKKLVPFFNIDTEIEINDLNWTFFEEVEKFAPFECSNGSNIGNKAPLFVLRNLKILTIRKVGSNGGHLKMYLEKKHKKIDAIGFNLGEFYDKIKPGDKIDVVFELIANDWNRNRELQLKIIDLRKK